MSTVAANPQPWPTRQPILFLGVGIAVWVALYSVLVPVSEAIVGMLPVDRQRLSLIHI